MPASRVVEGGFGGVYVMFGWVRDARGGGWRPSNGGLTGQDYQYIPDAEDAADNKGYLSFVAFPGSSTASEASAVLAADGSFTVDITIPGPVFQSVDRSGAVAQVDCRRVQCGVITIGAHGVKNPANESFTPVDFGDVYDQAPTADPDPGATGGSTDGTGGTDTGTGAGTAGSGTAAGATGTRQAGRRPAAARVAAVLVDRATAVQGRAMAFSGQGFRPGEQVVAVLDDGIAAIGPMQAGASGEVAGVLQLPVDLGVGTHELRLSGAASGTEVAQRFPVGAGGTAGTAAATEPVATEAASTRDDGQPAGWVFLGVAGAVLLLAVGGLVLGRVRRRPAQVPA
ncbi:hypothetical protein FE634_21590 [Nocardioides dongxiaopingii]|uniref:hypothetical protein n=1 Tax=Nocardioides sp. S-1144 TaxID=2582905 RepID=UPI001163E63C|nr:hypothetical protein [Nocardioides sp. S-1144]QDH10787.1 hypothetical protein FE634_21590 [Nocardioides sp. S-1144]